MYTGKTVDFIKNRYSCKAQNVLKNACLEYTLTKAGAKQTLLMRTKQVGRKYIVC